MPSLMCQTMPTSEEFQGKMPSETLSRTKVMEGRKSSKPLMEKRRRARINDSLTQLKTLILEATNKDTSRHSKLEKADILEMTVRYLKTLQRHQIVASIDSEVNATKYRMGYTECIGEVSRFLSPMDSNLVDLRLQLLSHLAQSCPMQKSSPPATGQQNAPSGQQAPPAASPALAPAAITTAHIPQQVQFQVGPSAGNTTIQTVPITVTAQPQQAFAAVPGATPVQVKNEATPVQVPQQSPTSVARIVQVGLPAGVTGGEIALVIPPQAFTNGQVPSHYIPVYSQHASAVLSPSSGATIPSVSQGVQSPVGTATASISQMPSSVSYQTITPTATVAPLRNSAPTNMEGVNKMGSSISQYTTAVPTSNSPSVPMQTYLTLRSPLQTSHHVQNQASLPFMVAKDTCNHEVDMEDQSCWRPW